MTPPVEQRLTISPIVKNAGLTREKSPEDLSGFFGSTSHPHVGTPLDRPRDFLENQSNTLDIGLDANSQHLKTHLIHSFFNYQTLWVDVVNKENFLAHQKQGIPSPWYCGLLENAILACATRLATSIAVRALGQEYLQLAKSEILNALQEPTPASLQALLLLSEYEVSYGNDRIGWMFCGELCLQANHRIWTVYVVNISRYGMSNGLRPGVARNIHGSHDPHTAAGTNNHREQFGLRSPCFMHRL